MIKQVGSGAFIWVRIVGLVVGAILSGDADTWGESLKPVLSESDHSIECGINALYIFLRLDGTAVSLSELQKQFPGYNAKGVSMSEIQGVARAFGLKLEGRDWARAPKNVSGPAIAYVEPDGVGHFIVVRPVGSSGKLVQVLDPPFVPEIVDIEKLTKAQGWTGMVLVPVASDVSRWWFALCICLVSVVVGYIVMGRLWHNYQLRPSVKGVDV